MRRYTTSVASDLFLLAVACLTPMFAGCGDDDQSAADADIQPGADAATDVDPATAPRAAIDRFAPGTGTLMVRDNASGLPAANAPIDFDEGPFVTQGFGPDGQLVRYYNFDVQSPEPADIYVLFPEGGDAPVEGQLNIVSVIPGDEGYTDFWRVVRVDVPEGYVANTVTSVEAITDRGFVMTPTTTLVNCPIVPEGSTATERLGGASAALHQGWYGDEAVFYFSFEEKPLAVVADQVPVSSIYVTFHINPDQPGGGPPSGFLTEDGTSATHNVVETVPADAGYSPLWSVNVYDNADFDDVSDLASAQAANILASGVALVNCPLIED